MSILRQILIRTGVFVLGSFVIAVLVYIGLWGFLVSLLGSVVFAVWAVKDGLPPSTAFIYFWVMFAASITFFVSLVWAYHFFFRRKGRPVLKIEHTNQPVERLDESPYPDLKLADFVRSHLGITNFLDPDPNSRIGRFLHNVREAALHERIQIWGRKDCEEGMEDFDLIVSEKIISSYWRNCKINEFEFVTKNGWAVTAQDGNDYCEHYGDLQVSKQQVEKIWPEVSV